MNKTGDIEFAIMAVLDGGPLALADLDKYLAWVDDRRWIGVAINLHLIKDGRARWVACNPDHNHAGDCVIEATR